MKKLKVKAPPKSVFVLVAAGGDAFLVYRNERDAKRELTEEGDRIFKYVLAPTKKKAKR